jgi:adenine phosphoribosyltransferase
MKHDAYHARRGTDTVGRYDVALLFGDRETFAELRANLVADAAFDDITHVVGIDALGFVLGGAVAAERDVGFVPVRKGGKLPYEVEELLRVEFTDDSETSKALELHPDRLGAGDRVLVVDE